MSIEGTRLYLDSNVFIYAFEANAGALYEAARRLVRGAYSAPDRGCTSLITRAETLVRPLRLRQAALIERYRALFQDNGPIALEPVDTRITDLAAELRADYAALKLPDALHVATAILTGCGAFVTGDRRLRAVSRRIPVLGLDQLANT